MSIDLRTLLLLTIEVEVVLGLLLLFVWIQNSAIRAVAWWGSAHLLRASSIALYGMYGTVSDLVSINLGDAILFCSYAVTWTGARVFDGRAPRPGSLFVGATVWLLATQLTGTLTAPESRALLSATIISAFMCLTAYEFWHGRSEPLVSRWPAVFIMFAHGAVFLLRTPLSAMLHWTPADHAYDSAWLTVISTEALLATISSAFILLAMAKERTELRHKTAALVDPLTGLANRRAFLQDAAALIRRQASRDRPVAVCMIDLDRFKSINDRFGHSVGDHALQIFAETTIGTIRATDLVGRLGGEEFAVVIADACRDNAFLVGEQIRLAFAAAATVINGHPVNATASVGVSIIQDPEQDVVTLLAQADQALYRAKHFGRNRVIVTGLGLAPDDVAVTEMDGGARAAA
jgi:diguanylate cyclase (GGDEF)-like protein